MDIAKPLKLSRSVRKPTLAKLVASFAPSALAFRTGLARAIIFRSGILTPMAWELRPYLTENKRLVPKSGFSAPGHGFFRHLRLLAYAANLQPMHRETIQNGSTCARRNLETFPPRAGKQCAIGWSCHRFFGGREPGTATAINPRMRVSRVDVSSGRLGFSLVGDGFHLFSRQVRGRA